MKKDVNQLSIFVDTPMAISLCNTFTSFCDSNPASTEGIDYAFGKAWHILRDRGKEYPIIMASVSGGSDSDIMVDLIERIGHPHSEVHYVYFNTGLEYKATFEQLNYLEHRYGIQIDRHRAAMPVPIAVRKYGYPFLSKTISQYIRRLQINNFQWEDKPYQELLDAYPNCKAALRWWCNEWGESSSYNISRRKWLKEFMIIYPPEIPISDMCCQKAKKDTAHQIEAAINPQLSCIGIRKSEGGQRASISSCFKDMPFGCSVFRPIFWLRKVDKKAYERNMRIRHSACYTDYGLDRTGCACCPFGKHFERELEAARLYEPNLYKAVCNVFGPAYEYTRKYKEFAIEMDSQTEK